MIIKKTHVANDFSGGMTPEQRKYMLGNKRVCHTFMDQFGYQLPNINKCSHDYLLAILSNQMFYFMKKDIRYTEIRFKPTVANCNAIVRAKLLEARELG